jgi:hypothetical protein
MFDRELELFGFSKISWPSKLAWRVKSESSGTSFKYATGDVCVKDNLPAAWGFIVFSLFPENFAKK